jgi:thiazole/oxazole-forming peptide maturase SagD family component
MPRLPLYNDFVENITNPFTGIVKQCQEIPRKVYDPAIPLWSALLAAPTPTAVGGAGWTEEQAFLACLGEAVERWQTRLFPSELSTLKSFNEWEHEKEEQALAPHEIRVFHQDQYALPDFPFRPWTPESLCYWTLFRELESGLPWWVPSDFCGLMHPAFSSASLSCAPFTPLVSTGLSSGLWGQNVLLKAIQEVIERDGLMKGWWGEYPIKRYPANSIWLKHFTEEERLALQRPNLEYRFYQIDSPFTRHLCLVSLEGEDETGYIFAVGSACRETQQGSWKKAILEAIQDRSYVRYLKNRIPPTFFENRYSFRDFSHHALFYSYFPERLSETALQANSLKQEVETEERMTETESLNSLISTLKPFRIFFRQMTPLALAQNFPECYVLQVLIPGLQGLYADERFPFLGSAFWEKRPLYSYGVFPPHPFP